MTYYIIETTYIGPNQDQDRYIDADSVVISTTPAMANMSREPVIDGWAGTTNGWSVMAHGEYVTLDDARAALNALYPDGLRDAECMVCDDDVIEMYRIGDLEPWTSESSCMWCWNEATARINADTTDAEIAALIDEWVDAARDEASAALDRRAVERMCEGMRSDLRYAD